MVSIPKYLADNERRPFPAGVWKGTIEEASTRWSEDGKNMTARVRLENMVNIENGEKASRAYSFALPVVSGGNSLVDVVDFDDESVPFQLRRAGGLAASLALALGAATVSNGNVNVDLDRFLQDLCNGVYKGREVVVEIGHRTYTSKRTGNTVVDDSPIRFAAAE